MALKMPKARLVRPPPAATIIVDAGTYHKLDQPGALTCVDVRCNAELRHVPRHPENKRNVQAYFGRKSKAVHARNCRFNVTATVTRIVAGSVHFEEGRKPIVIGQDGRAVFRLNIVFDDIRSLTTLADRMGDDPEAGEGADYVAGVRALSPYLRRAKAVLALIARLGDTDELRDVVRISYGGADIPWRDFFYGPDELGRLYGRLQGLQDASRPVHPVAVVLRPTRGRRTTVRDAVIRCLSEELAVPSGGTVRIAPCLSCRPPALAGGLITDRPYLLCGLPRPRRGDLDLRPGQDEVALADVYMDVVSRNQFALWPH